MGPGLWSSRSSPCRRSSAAGGCRASSTARSSGCGDASPTGNGNRYGCRRRVPSRSRNDESSYGVQRQRTDGFLPRTGRVLASRACLRLIHRLAFPRMLDWNQCPAVERNPEKVSGAWVFRGTRVPVQALFANLEEGARLDDFLEWFPGVSREQAEAVLKHAEQSLAVA